MMDWNRTIRAAVREVTPYVPGKRGEDGGEGAPVPLKLSSNECAFPTSEPIMSSLREALGELNRYPDPDCDRLKTALSERHEVPRDRIAIGSGSNELLDILAWTVLDPGDEVVYPWPSFIVYPSMAHKQGAVAVPVPLTDDYAVDLEALLDAVTERTKVVLVCNPNNPTSTALPVTDMESFLARVPEGVLVVFDEAYIEYADPALTGSMLNVALEDERVVVLRTFSKPYGLAGLRVGWGVMAPELVKALDAMRAPFNVNTLAQVAAEAALADDKTLDDVVAENAEAREEIHGFLAGCGLPAIVSHTNFVWIPYDDPMTLEGDLAARGFIIRRFPDGVRITLGTVEETRALIQALQEVCLG